MQGRGKEIFLLVLAVGALGLALYTFRGKPASAPAPSGPAAPAPAAEGAGEEVAGTPEGGTAATEGSERASAAGTDPFSLPGAAASEPGTVGTAGTAEPGAGGATQVPVEPPPGEIERPPVQTGFKLEGIVTGQPSFAVIRYEGKPHFVKVGDSVNAYRVEAIRGGNEVVLAGQQGTVVLRTGKSS